MAFSYARCRTRQEGDCEVQKLVCPLVGTDQTVAPARAFYIEPYIFRIFFRITRLTTWPNDMAVFEAPLQGAKVFLE